MDSHIPVKKHAFTGQTVFARYEHKGTCLLARVFAFLSLSHRFPMGLATHHIIERMNREQARGKNQIASKKQAERDIIM